MLIRTSNAKETFADNHGHNILRIFDVLPNFPFTKNETKPQFFAKNILEKLRKLRKSCKHEQKNNGIYNDKLHYNRLQQLPTLRLKTYDLRKFRNLGERK